MKSMPVIGIPGRKDALAPVSTPVQIVSQSCLEAILAAGGVPVVIPVGMSLEALEVAFGVIHGLLLPGGPHPVRNPFEMLLVQKALEDGLPVLGICRGIQLLNVAAGGTHHSIEAQVPGALQHSRMTTQELRKTLAHDVTLETESQLARLIGKTKIGVNSGHGWACDQLAPGFQAVARAPDGIIEAIEAQSGFALGVQWHPEELVGQEDWALRLFEVFIEAARG